MDIEAAIKDIEAELCRLADPGRAEHEKRYLKSELAHLGVPVPAIRKVAVSAVGGPITREELLQLASVLWREPIHERRVAAVEVLIRRVALLTPDDLAAVEKLIRESRTWALVDALAVKVVGELVMRHPQLVATLDRWVEDSDLWVRRSALLALLPAIRGRKGDLARLSVYGDKLSGEREFFIRKALGWVLRELSRRDPAWVRDWVAARVDRLSGLTIREAIRHLSETDRTRLLATYQAR